MAAIIELQSPHWRAVVAPGCGGGLVRLDWIKDGAAVSILRHGDERRLEDTDQLACYPLVPWSNRLGGRGLPKAPDGVGYVQVPNNRPGDRYPVHGDAWQSPWSVAERDATHVVLRHAGQPWLPFRYRAEMQYQLDDSGFRCELTAHNEDDAPVPFGLGMHPYFLRTPETKVRMKACHTWPPQSDRLPGRCVPIAATSVPADGQWQPLPDHELDHCAGGWNGRAEIAWPEHGLTAALETWPPAPFFVMYTPPEERYFCLEPVTHANDAHRRQPGGGDLGVRWLQPGETMRLEMRLTVYPCQSAAKLAGEAMCRAAREAIRHEQDRRSTDRPVQN